MREPLRRGVGVLLVALIAVTTLVGCSPKTTPATPVAEVTGDFGRRPQVAFDTPLTIDSPSTSILIDGEGSTLTENSPVLLSFVAFSAADGAVVDESYGLEPRSFNLTPDLGPLYEELLRIKEGSRLLYFSQGTTSRPEPVVLVYDVLHTQAWGEEVEHEATDPALPRVTRAEDGRPTVKIPAADPPSKLKIVTLIKGTGPQVEEGDLLTAHYSSVSWESGDEFDSTWGEDRLSPPAISFAGLIPAWQTGLAGATVGSQIMIIAPPEDAFGADTVVFIIDILASTTPEGSTHD